MKYTANHTRNDGKASSLTVDLLDNPLNFIAEDHMREREICAIIDRLVVQEPPDKDDCGQVITFLSKQLPQHLADEEIDLFPMMLKRCEPEDEIHKIIDRLLHDHEHAFTDTPHIIMILEDEDVLRDGLSEEARAQMTAFATHARRHMIMENAIILPIARARLTKKDLKIMKQHMLERRGLDQPPELSQDQSASNGRP